MAYIGPDNRERKRPVKGGIVFVLFADDSSESRRRLAQIQHLALEQDKDVADIVSDLLEATLDVLFDADN
jgi:hypothetical protein